MKVVWTPVLLLLTALIPASVSAQAVSKAYGDTTVEVIGLSSWSIDELQEAVYEYAPGVSLAEHACAVVLRDSVGFADAAAIGMNDWMILMVVEPDRRELVRYRRAPDTDRGVRPEYEDILTIFRADRSAIQPLQHGEVLMGDATSLFGNPLPASVDSLRAAIRARSSRQDYVHAVGSILLDGNRDNRTIAALVLSNFAQQDSAWHALVEGVRTEPDFAASIATMVLGAMAETGKYRVDWAPARDALEAILGGTNLFAYIPMLQVLVETKIDPALGRELASVNPDLLLDSAAADNPHTPVSAQAFLRYVTGEDHGSDINAWKAALHGHR